MLAPMRAACILVWWMVCACASSEYQGRATSVVCLIMNLVVNKIGAQPTRQPTGQPTRQPSRQPTGQPTRQPLRRPSSQPSHQPSSHPSAQPVGHPSTQPTRRPSSHPSAQPSANPTNPTGQPSAQPSGQPSAQPTNGAHPLPPFAIIIPNYATFISEAIAGTSSAALVVAKIALATALGAFGCSAALSWMQGLTDVETARRTLRLLRFYIFADFVLLAVLLYYLLTQGSPVPITSALALLPDGKTNWLFSFWRPLTSLLLVGAGTMASTAPAPKLVCLLGCVWELVQNLVSLVQLDDYETQASLFRAPRGSYSRDDLLLLFWRDVAGLGVAFATLFTLLHLAAIQGVLTLYEPPYVTYAQIRGALSDRPATMRRQRTTRLRTELAQEVMIKGDYR